MEIKDIKKLSPLNWFSKKSDESVKPLSISSLGDDQMLESPHKPLRRFHDRLDSLIENFYSGFGPSSFMDDKFWGESMSGGLLKPTLDIEASESEYVINIEVPGVDQNDIKLELTNNTIIVKGEKKRQKEQKLKDYYRMERAYGSFQRVLALPEDANRENVNAQFKNGVLTVTIARKELPKSDLKKIEIK